MSHEFKSALTIEEIKTLLKEIKNQIIGIQETIETFKSLGIPEIVLEPWRERLNQCREEHIQIINLFNKTFKKEEYEIKDQVYRCSHCGKVAVRYNSPHANSIMIFCEDCKTHRTFINDKTFS